MKKIVKLKLGQLNKDSMVERQMAQLMGGNFCYWSLDNQVANDTQGKCSCLCNNCDYYDSSAGLQCEASSLLDWDGTWGK